MTEILIPYDKNYDVDTAIDKSNSNIDINISIKDKESQNQQINRVSIDN